MTDRVLEHNIFLTAPDSLGNAAPAAATPLVGGRGRSRKPDEAEG